MLEILSLCAFALALVAFLVLDRVRPARTFAPRPWWKLKGAVFFAVNFVVSSTVPLWFDGWLAEHRLIDATSLGVGGGALVGLIVLDLVAYLWHRALHAVPWLWRLHQTHHSAERIDIWSSMLFHPLDMAGFTLMGSVALVFGLGVRPEAALIALTLNNVLALFQHANVATPRWLGYLVQRPENHCEHHARRVHRNNYGSLSIWDMAFGTFSNPRCFEGAVGFYDGASDALGRLLVARSLAPTGGHGRADEGPMLPSADS